ncbi:hypothetical protein [Synechococcus sp. NOUM97013]|nr:hypothetical protein [Synechococcus sp. NOUM97013]QNI73912.1 putative membrane protein [Synechococcus sp. NOUM97013]
MKAKQWFLLAAAVITVTGAGIGIMLGEIHQGDLPKDAALPVAGD